MLSLTRTSLRPRLASQRGLSLYIVTVTSVQAACTDVTVTVHRYSPLWMAPNRSLITRSNPSPVLQKEHQHQHEALYRSLQTHLIAYPLRR